MDGLRLIGINDNETILKQEKRGQGIGENFDSDSFIRENIISLDISYIFDTPETSSISRKDLENLIPEILDAHKKLLNGEGDIRDGQILMTGWQNLPDEIQENHIAKYVSEVFLFHCPPAIQNPLGQYLLLYR